MVLLLGGPSICWMCWYFLEGGKKKSLVLYSPTTIRDTSHAETFIKRCWITLSPEPNLFKGFKSCAHRETRCCSVTRAGTASDGNVHRPLSIPCYSIKLLDDELGNCVWIYSALSSLCCLLLLLPTAVRNKRWTSSWRSLKYICFYLFKNSDWELMLSRIRKVLFLGFV